MPDPQLQIHVVVSDTEVDHDTQRFYNENISKLNAHKVEIFNTLQGHTNRRDGAFYNLDAQEVQERHFHQTCC